MLFKPPSLQYFFAVALAHGSCCHETEGSTQERREGFLSKYRDSSVKLVLQCGHERQGLRAICWVDQQEGGTKETGGKWEI